LKNNTTDNKSYADCYYENRSSVDEQASVVLELISNLIGDVSKKTFLDVGSGPGRLAIPIGLKAKELVCVEPDLEAVKYLKYRAEKNNLKIKVYPVQIQDLFGENIGFFDLVMLSHIIHWIDFSLLLNITKNFVKSHGYILLSYFDLNNLKNMLFYKISGEEILQIQENHALPMSQIESELNQANFKIICQKDVPLNVNYGNGKLERIINSAGTLAWQKAQSMLSEEDFVALKLSALMRLNCFSCLNDIEYRTIILAQKQGI